MIDLDNTLGDRTAATHAWIDEFVRDRKLAPEARDWFLRADNDGYSARSEVFAAFRDEWDLAETVDQLVDTYRQRIVALTRPTTGALECLIEMRRQGWSIVIVTNGSSKQQHAKIDKVGFRPMVDAVIVSGDLDIKKPDPRIYQAAAEAAGHTLDGGWMVGDSAVHDVVGAQTLGLKTAWLHRDREWPPEHTTPTAILGDLTALVASILEHS